MLVVSVLARELRFDGKKKTRKLAWRRNHSRIGMAVIATSPSLCPASTWRVMIARFHRGWQRLFGRRGLFGIESDAFDDVYAGREVVEIAFQTYQAYRTSQMISALWINNFFVALVVLNCWSTPVLHYAFRFRPALGRLACITTDLVLNIFTNMVIPWILFRSYDAYDKELYSFDLSLLYDDVWFTNLVLENRLLVVLSLIDFISKLIPYQLADGSDSNGCKQAIWPWFIKDVACATYEYNCDRLQDEINISNALGQIDPTTLVSLIISHGQDLVVPPTIRNFTNLLSIELYTVTLLEWGRDAALSPTIHTSLVVLLLIHVNMTSFPEGNYLELPAALTDIAFAYTNLTTLPDDLHKRWHPMVVFYFEFSQVREFPSMLTQLEVYDLSLIDNQMERIPARVNSGAVV